MIHEIEVHNADGLCTEQSCGSDPTHYIIKKVGPLTCYLPFCEEHAQILEESENG